ncbi:MAG: efflux RND transporter permease subunit [Balneolales bacterium]|nr:efflux RND transporter permease subunit [Balneolales bacterium]
MNFTTLTLKNRTAILMLTFILIVAGIGSYFSIPKESAPSVDVPFFFVTTIYPGIGPADMESLVTQPLERQMQGINGVKEIRSTTQESVSIIVVEFELSVPNMEASQRVRERVDLARSDLPTDAEDPLIIEASIDDFPIMTINLAADYSLVNLTNIAERLQDNLEALSGIREVDVIGGIEREVQVNVDLNALTSYNLALGQLIGAIQNQNLTIPGGSVDVDRFSYLLRVSGEIKDPAELENIVISAPEAVDGEPTPGLVYMRDVAEVVYDFKERESYSRLKAYQVEDRTGKLVKLDDADIEELQVVSLSIKRRPGSNILSTADEIFNTIEEFNFPAGTRVIVTGDESQNVQSLISDLENSIISGMLFVILVLVFFLGIRNALLVGTAVPLSIFVGFLVLNLAGFTVNFVILFALIIALGLLVDNAVVVVENIFRYREAGLGRFEAAVKGTSEVGGALIAATTTLVAAFLPLTFWPGVIGQFMSYLPTTLIIVLLCSLFVALVLYPTLTVFFVKTDTDERKKSTTFGKVLKWVILVFGGLIILAANWITFVVLILLGLFFYLSYKYFIMPLSYRFTNHFVPALIDRYQILLNTMLYRDYTVYGSWFRNMTALVGFSLGALLLLLSSIIGTFAPLAASIPQFLGFVAMGIGLLGIFVHTIEAMLRGAKAVLLTGIGILILVGIIIAIAFMNGGMDAQALTVLLGLPFVLIIFGGIGTLLKLGKPLILTDNRALLLNAVLGLLISIFAAFALAPTGVQFFPQTDPAALIVNIEGPIGMNVDASDEIAHQVQQRIDDMLNEHPSSRGNIENIVINVGVSGDDIFGGGQPRAELSRIRVNLVDYADRTEPSTVTLSRLRDQMSDIPDVSILVDIQQQGPPTGAPVNIEVTGENFEEITRITAEIRAKLDEASRDGSIKGLVDVKDNISGGVPEYAIRIDTDRAGQFGLSIADIAQTIRIAMNGLEASKFRDGEDEYDITVRLREEDRRGLESLDNVTIFARGQQIPLSSVAYFEETRGIGSITRLNQQRTATVEGEAAPGFNGPEVLAETQAYLADYLETVPVGYTIRYTGENEEQNESFSFLTNTLLISFALIFFVMLIKFNSLSAPIIIMIAVGLSLIGVILGLILTRTPFGLMTFIGIISLAGIVCVNNIVLVDYLKQLIDNGMSRKDAIIQAGSTRLRPVLLTATTTILGLVPLTFGINIDFVGLLVNFDPAFQIGSDNTAFWGPMGVAIISGLTFATFLTLMVVPVMFSAFDSISDRFSVLLGNEKSVDDVKFLEQKD